MRIIKFSLLTLFIFLISLSAFAQKKVDMADQMRSNGRIYVVVAVVLLILFGLFLYLIRLDRKISRLEKENH
jgi:predicted Na+-dependent transporter